MTRDNSPNVPPTELCDLIVLAGEGQLTDEQTARLEKLVTSDDDACLQYALLMHVQAGLWRRMRGNAGPVGDGPRSLLEDGILAESDASTLMNAESRTPRHLSSHAPLPQVIIQTAPSPLPVFPVFVGSAIFSYLAAAVIVGIGLMVAAAWRLSDRPQIVTEDLPSIARPGEESVSKTDRVGQITGMLDCVWEGTGDRAHGSGAANQKSEIIDHKSTIRLGDRLALRSGLLEITYDTGARVILQGPVTYEVESPSGGYLAVGKLTAKLEKKVASRQWPVVSDRKSSSPQSLAPSPSSNPQSLIPNPSLATNHYPLFTIKTPTALVTDLGTEFGVEVDKNGDTRSHVFRGSVRVQRCSTDGTETDTGRVLHEDQGVHVSRDGAVTTDSGKSRSRIDFVRQMPQVTVKPLDLVDVVAGGNGFSVERNRGIDPRNGRVTDTLLTAPNPMVGDNRYHRVDGLSFIDGIFIPSSGETPVQLDSAGHRFDGFAATGNRTSDYLWAGGPFGGNRTDLGGVDYASSGHGLLALHANKGITFDLDAVRRANPGWKPLRFLATAGNTETASERGEAVFADIWVFVDGQVRFKRWQVNRYGGAWSVNVPIADGERFLTLVATDGGNGISYDHILFGDPRIEMKAANPPAGSGSSPAAVKH